LKYNNPEHPTLIIEELLGDAEVSEEEFLAMGFDNILRPIGKEWLYDIKNAKGSIKVFEYAISLMPNNSNLHFCLGEAYFEDKDWNNAIRSFAKSLVLNPENKEAVEILLKVQEAKGNDVKE